MFSSLLFFLFYYLFEWSSHRNQLSISCINQLWRLVGGASSLPIVTASTLKITLTFKSICVGIFPFNTCECIFCLNYFIYKAEVFCNLSMYYLVNAEASPEIWALTVKDIEEVKSMWKRLKHPPVQLNAGLTRLLTWIITSVNSFSMSSWSFSIHYYVHFVNDGPI